MTEMETLCEVQRRSGLADRGFFCHSRASQSHEISQYHLTPGEVIEIIIQALIHVIVQSQSQACFSSVGQGLVEGVDVQGG